MYNSSILGCRDIDLQYDKERAKRIYTREKKFYLDFTTNLRKISVYRQFPFFLHLRPLTQPQQDCLRMLISATRETLLKNTNVSVISGPGGSGKSVVINAYCSTLVQQGIRFYVCSASASASQQFKAFTLHTLAGIYNCKLSTKEMIALPISPAVKERLKMAQIIIIDEFSLLGPRLLSLLLHRINKCKNTDTDLPVSLVLSGDEMQLAPVASPGLWEEPKIGSDPYVLHGQQIFQGAHYTFTLQTNLRQAGDIPYADLLSRLHSSKIVEKDLQLLESRRDIRLPRDEIEIFKNSIRLFSTNQLCRDYNIKYLLSTEISILRIDPQLDPYCPICKDRFFPLYLGQNVGVTLLRNLVTTKSLYNGSSGRVSEIYFDNKNDSFPQFVSVVFNDYDSTALPDLSIPIPATIEREFCPHLKTFIKIKQFPLVPNYSSTIHRSQSSSYDSCVISFQGIKPWEKRKVYTALSRVRSSKGLLIISDSPLIKFFS